MFTGMRTTAVPWSLFLFLGGPSTFLSINFLKTSPTPAVSGNRDRRRETNKTTPGHLPILMKKFSFAPVVCMFGKPATHKLR